jgi:hypothetical protein
MTPSLLLEGYARVLFPPLLEVAAKMLILFSTALSIALSIASSGASVPQDIVIISTFLLTAHVIA